MIRQRPIYWIKSFGLNVLKITYPPVESNKRGWLIEPMKFIPHNGKATHDPLALS